MGKLENLIFAVLIILIISTTVIGAPPPRNIKGYWGNNEIAFTDGETLTTKVMKGGCAYLASDAAAAATFNIPLYSKGLSFVVDNRSTTYSLTLAFSSGENPILNGVAQGANYTLVLEPGAGVFISRAYISTAWKWDVRMGWNLTTAVAPS